MNIRLLDKKDWPSFKALRLEALHMHPEAFGSSYEEEAILSGDAFEKNFNKSNIFGAFQEKQLVGCAGFFIHNPSKMAHRGVVFSMYTKPEYRSLGIGDALLKAVIAHAKKVVIQLHLTVVTTNQSALRL